MRDSIRAVLNPYLKCRGFGEDQISAIYESIGHANLRLEHRHCVQCGMPLLKCRCVEADRGDGIWAIDDMLTTAEWHGC